MLGALSASTSAPDFLYCRTADLLMLARVHMNSVEALPPSFPHGLVNDSMQRTEVLHLIRMSGNPAAESTHCILALPRPLPTRAAVASGCKPEHLVMYSV
jgi:hypothetical protein